MPAGERGIHDKSQEIGWQMDGGYGSKNDRTKSAQRTGGNAEHVVGAETFPVSRRVFVGRAERDGSRRLHAPTPHVVRKASDDGSARLVGFEIERH